MRLKRKLLAVAAAFVLLLMAAAAGWQIHNYALGNRLIEEVRHLSQTRQRDSHRAPVLAGITFQQCLGPLVDTTPDAGLFGFEQASEVKTAISDVRDGLQPIESLQADTRADAARLLPWATAVVGCTRADSVGVGPGLGPFADWDHPRAKVMPPPGLIVPEVLGIEMWNRMSREDASGAVRICADLLAFARDLVSDKGLIGAMLAQRILTAAFAPCTTAVDMANIEARQRFADELVIIRRGFPTFRKVLEIERAEMQLLGFGHLLTAAQVERLPEHARGLTTNAFEAEQTGTKRLVSWLYWGGYVKQIDGLIEAADQPDRDARFTVITKGDSLGLIFSDGVPSSMLKFAKRYDTIGHAFDLLESAASVSLGKPPIGDVSAVATDGITTLSGPWGEEDAVTLEVRASPEQ